MTVTTAKESSIYIDDIDRLQNKWDLATQFASDMQRVHNNYLEQQLMSEYSNASASIIASDMGGSGSGTYLSSTANIMNLLFVAGRKLTAKDIPSGNRFAVIGPRDIELLQLYAGGKETAFGDKVEMNGFVGNRGGFDIFASNNVPFTSTWTPADNPSDGATVTIGGVVYSFESSTIDTDGHVNIGSTTAESIANLVAAINLSGTAGTDYQAVGDSDRWSLTKAGIVATDGTTNMTIVGYGDIVVASSESADPWSAQTSYPLFGKKGAIRFLVQMPTRVKFTQPEKKHGRNVLSLSLHGKKTFNQNKDALVYATQDASNWS